MYKVTVISLFKKTDLASMKAIQNNYGFYVASAKNLNSKDE